MKNYNIIVFKYYVTGAIKLKNIKDYNLEELKQKLINMGEKPFRAEQIFKWIWNWAYLL